MSWNEFQTRARSRASGLVIKIPTSARQIARMDLSRDIQERMNNMAYYFAHKLRMNVQAILKKDKYRSSGELEKSVRVRVKEANAYEPPVIIMEVEDYGEFIGKRKLLFPRQPPLKPLIEWVQREGLVADSSAPVLGYKNGAPKLDRFKRAERIAFAIAIAKSKKQVTVKCCSSPCSEGNVE